MKKGTTFSSLPSKRRAAESEGEGGGREGAKGKDRGGRKEREKKREEGKTKKGLP